MTTVPGWGSSSARLVIVGEAPGREEESQGIPFVGASGNILNEVLEAAGTCRDDVYITNVCKVRPPDNDIKRISETGTSLSYWTEELYKELRDINPNAILALGNTALEALTGNRGIDKYRGSILICAHTGHKVIPTLHPASLLHGSSEGMASWKELYYIKYDAKRAVEQALTRHWNPPPRNLLIAQNSLDTLRFLERAVNASFITLDVETFKTLPICVGLSYDQFTGFCIPTLSEDIPMSDLVYTWKFLAEFLGDTKVKIVAQNAKFDEKVCRRVKLTWHDCWFDMACAWHVLYPEFPKSLQFISSILTEEPYYKDEGKEYNPKRDDIRRLYTYNCKDAVTEWECSFKILEELKAENLYEFFFDKIAPLHRLYSELEDVGILVDPTIRKRLREKYVEKLRIKNEEVIRLIGNPEDTFGVLGRKDKKPIVHQIKVKDFNVDSPTQVASMLYGHLKCPVRKDTQESTLKALANNALKDERRKNIVQGILETRKIGKTIGTYIDSNLSAFNRCHTTVNINGAETGRTSNSALKPPVVVTPQGIALQTMTKHEDTTMDAGGADLRAMFIVDPGWTFIEVDQAQAEDRVVCVLAKDWKALKDYERTEFKKNKHGLKDDRHTVTAMMVCGKSFDEITDFDRQVGKRTRHAGNYDMGKHQGMITYAKYGIFVSEWRVGQWLTKFHDENPQIRCIFHQGVQDALQENDCRLVNPFGRQRIFYNRWGDELFKEAYAQIPQSTVGDQTKFAMTRIRQRIKEHFYFVQESHDSFLALCRDEYLKEYIPICVEEMQAPIDFNKCTMSRNYQLVIPADVKAGKRWIEASEEYPDGMKKWKNGV